MREVLGSRFEPGLARYPVAVSLPPELQKWSAQFILVTRRGTLVK